MAFVISGPLIETDRQGFREWLSANHDREQECWLIVCRGRPVEGRFNYIDAVEEALCFGWIDSVQKRHGGRTVNRFSPRRKDGHWTELNKARFRRLERLGLMTDAGRAAYPGRDRPPRADRNIRRWFSENPEMEKRFMGYPELYRRIQLSNLEFYRENLPQEYRKRLRTFRERIEKDSMLPGWDDYGRLTAEDAGIGEGPERP